jgi:hypothetical protein
VSEHVLCNAAWPDKCNKGEYCVGDRRRVVSEHRIEDVIGWDAPSERPDEADKLVEIRSSEPREQVAHENHTGSERVLLPLYL